MNGLEAWLGLPKVRLTALPPDPHPHRWPRASPSTSAHPSNHMKARDHASSRSALEASASNVTLFKRAGIQRRH